MSGIFGFAGLEKRGEAKQMADQMAELMSHRDWYVKDHHVDPSQGIAIGRLGIGIFNSSTQPIFNAAGTMALVMAGEFYRIDAPDLQSNSRGDEEIALSLYERYGDRFVERLEGAFIIGLWDKEKGQIIIANDRFALYPLYYTCQGKGLIFSPEVKGILCHDRFKTQLDLTALAQYIRFQHLLGERTFFEDIQLLPNASLLIYDLATASCTVKPYWTFDDIPYHPDISFNEAVEETGQLLRQAVQRLSGDSYRHGVYLSGGLDSRTILGLVDRRPVVSVTYGTQESRDVYYARQIARAVGSQHHWFDLPNGEWVKEHVDFHLDLTEGFHSWIHAHGISTLSEARKLMDINLTGWDGGTVMGHPEMVEPRKINAVDQFALATRLFDDFTQICTWPSITEAEEQFLFCEPIRKKIQGLAFDSLCSELSEFVSYRPDVRADWFFIRNHDARLTNNLVTFTRSHIEVRFPFFDYDLFEFLYSLPSQVRGRRTLYRAVIQRETPRLAYIPEESDGLLPTTQPLIHGTHALSVKLKRRFNRHLWTLFPERDTLYADYEDYLRGDLLDWAEEILFDRRTMERGIFNPDFLRTLMARHLSGLEEWTIGKIAPIMTYEMMLRRFYD
jgi:asparagine synthase (glutamine-hydrolysing)